MENPNSVNLMPKDEIKSHGWVAESRDADGHMVSCHGPFDEGYTGIAGWILECTRNGETVTFWPLKSQSDKGD